MRLLNPTQGFRSHQLASVATPNEQVTQVRPHAHYDTECFATSSCLLNATTFNIEILSAVVEADYLHMISLLPV